MKNVFKALTVLLTLFNILKRQGAVRKATHVDFRALKRTADVSSQAVLDDLRGEQ